MAALERKFDYLHYFGFCIWDNAEWMYGGMEHMLFMIFFVWNVFKTLQSGQPKMGSYYFTLLAYLFYPSQSINISLNVTMALV